MRFVKRVNFTIKASDSKRQIGLILQNHYTFATFREEYKNYD